MNFERLKGQATYWEKILEKYILDEGLVFRMHEELLKFSNKKHNQFLKWTLENRLH